MQALVKFIAIALLATFGLTGCSFHLFGPSKDTFYETVLDRFPDNRAALFGQGQVLLRNGQYQEALPYLKRLTRLEPDNQQVWLTLGRAYLEARDGLRAERAFRRAISIRPTMDGELGLGNALMLQGDLSAARSVADRIAASYGESAYLWRLRGDIAFMADDPAEAARAYNESLGLDPAQPSVQERLADLSALVQVSQH